MNLNQLTIKEAKEGLQGKKFSSVDLTKACLDQIEKHNGELNAFITVCKDQALAAAKKADEKIANGNDAPLLGIPLGLKDIFLTKGIKTTAASNVLKDYIPQYDGTVVKKLKDAGVVIIGKTNLDAWAHGSSGENSDFGPTKNPWNKDYIPGGSSSGSAAALAADMCLVTTGTDTGGSIRLPASFCNVVGLKPTYGRVSRSGIIAMASSLDSIGHFTKTVEDSALMLSVTAGKDFLDATTPEIPVPDYTKNLNKGIKNLKIGRPSHKSEFLEESINVFRKLGAEIIDIEILHEEYAIPTYYIIQTAEVSSNLARYDGIRYGFGRENFGDEAKRRIMLGTYVLSAGYYDAYYKKAMQVRTLIVEDFKKAFQKVDAIVYPVSPTKPWKFGEKVKNPLDMYLSDIFTVTANMAGIPGLAMPAGIDGKGNLPGGIQILGPHFSENLLFQIGYAYEQATQWHTKKPLL